MQKIKNEKGITLVVLIVTMILLTIIAVVSIDYAYDGISYSAERRVLTELEEVQQAVMEKYTEFKQLDIDENEDSYLNIADEISVSDLETYSSKLKHVYTNSAEIEPSKRYYTLTKDQLHNLDVEIKTNISETDFTIKGDNREILLYIVNFYYGEVLNIYYSKDFKSEYSGQELYTIGRTLEPNSNSNLADIEWGDSISVPEKDGIQMNIETTYSSRYSRGTVTIEMKNVSDTTKKVSNIELLAEDVFDSAKLNDSGYYNYYELSSEENSINIGLSNYGDRYYSGINPGRTYTITFYVYYESEPEGKISLVNYECE